jgi:hypothetical protein
LSERRSYEKDHTGVNLLVNDEQRGVGAIRAGQGKLAWTNRCPTYSHVRFDRPTRAEALDEVKRPGVLKMLEDDTKAKLEKAGIPFSRSQFADEIGKDYGRLIVLAKLDMPNGFETEVKLLQRVRLARDPSIEFDAVTWSLAGVGNKLEIPTVRSQIADLIDRFIGDYLSVNPKQTASSGKNKSRDTKH